MHKISKERKRLAYTPCDKYPTEELIVVRFHVTPIDFIVE
jgi:hypothetical protein